MVRMFILLFFGVVALLTCFIDTCLCIGNRKRKQMIARLEENEGFSSGLETSTKNSRNGKLGVWRDGLLHLCIGNLFPSGIVRVFPILFRLPLGISAFYHPKCSTVLLFYQTLHVVSQKI